MQKRSFFLIVVTGALSFSIVKVHGQDNRPQSSTLSPVSNIIPVPSSYINTPDVYNYTRTWVPQRPVTNSADIQFALNPSMILGYTTQEKTTYLNGWGKPVEDIQRGCPSPATSSKDIVVPYDNTTSLTKTTFLPYPHDQAPGSPYGSPTHFQENPFSTLTDGNIGYYAQQYPLESTTAAPTSASQQIVSNDNKIPTVTTYVPGLSFVGMQVGNTTTTTYNDLSDPLQNIPSYTYNGGLIPLGTYAAGQLSVKTTTAPNDEKQLEFYDKDSKLVSKKVYAGVDGSNNPIYLTTHYVYNDFDRLSFIVLPNSADGGYINPSNNYEFLYDKWGNIIDKYIPGRTHTTDGEATVYDAKQRPVFRSTPLMGQLHKWQFFIYDTRDRVVVSGYVNSYNSRQQWQDLVDQYQNGTYFPPAGDIISYVGNSVTGNSISPSFSIANCEVDAINYYDNYQTPDPLVSSNAFADFSSDYLTGSYYVTPAPYMLTQGLLTASKVRVRDGSNVWETSVYYYDQKAHLIQTQTLNPQNNPKWNVLASQYSFSGLKVLDILLYNDVPTSNKQTTKVLTNYQYDFYNARLLGVQMKIDNDFWRPLSAYTYDALNRVKTKTLGGVEKQNYEYNIRGQLTAINRDYTQVPPITTTDETFGCTLSYDYGFTDNRTDGRIAGMQWRTAGSSLRAYGYNYDDAGRITGADFNEMPNNGSVYWNHNSMDYTVSNVTYDNNGNIQTMNQRGTPPSVSNPVDIDLLTYRYNGDQLESVTDAATAYNVGDFTDGPPGQPTPNIDYTYDHDGNLTSDYNKQIASIVYNEQDEPLIVNFNNGNSIVNTYDAAGTLLTKNIHDGPNNVDFHYRYYGPFVYRNDSLLYILDDEGRARWDVANTTFDYDFFVKDHLGNVRSMVTSIPYPQTNYLATYEIANTNVEAATFININTGNTNNPSSTDPLDQKAQMLNGTDDGTRVGASLMLHTMAGDKFDLNVQSYWDPTDTPFTTYATGNAMISSLIGVLSGNVSNASGGEAANTTLINNMSSSLTNVFPDAFQSIMDESSVAGVPRAYLNYLVFDDNMNLQADQSGAVQIGASPSEWNTVQAPTLSIKTNGYVVFYVSNAQHSNVFFNNLNVYAYRGQLLQSQHYYPFGLTVGMDQATSNPLPGKFLYQGKELHDELGFDLYDFTARQYDPQIGRFWGIDPANQYPSGYTGMGNDPANMVDPTGMAARGIAGGGTPEIDGVAGDIPYSAYISGITNNSDVSGGEVIGVLSGFLDATNEEASSDAFRHGGSSNLTDGGQQPLPLLAAIIADEKSVQSNDHKESTLGEASYKNSKHTWESASDDPGDDNQSNSTINTATGQATVYVETDGIGHAYVEVDGTVFSFGRYNGSYSPSSGRFGPYGDGVLLKKDGQDAKDFIDERTKSYPTNSYVVNGINTAEVYAYFNSKYESGEPVIDKQGNVKEGRVIGTYSLVGPGGNNCTTIVCKALNAGGANMQIFQTPASLNFFFFNIGAMKQGYNPGLWGPKQ